MAERDSFIVGHALFTPVSNGDFSMRAAQAMALGPVAVRPSQQGEGVGSALIQAGIERCEQAGHQALFVLGDPGFYQRFGWQAASGWGLECRWEVPPGVFQAMELVSGALGGWQGLVSYHSVFDELD